MKITTNATNVHEFIAQLEKSGLNIKKTKRVWNATYIAIQMPNEFFWVKAETVDGQFNAFAFERRCPNIGVVSRSYNNRLQMAMLIEQKIKD